MLVIVKKLEKARSINVNSTWKIFKHTFIQKISNMTYFLHFMGGTLLFLVVKNVKIKVYYLINRCACSVCSDKKIMIHINYIFKFTIDDKYPKSSSENFYTFFPTILITLIR